MRINSLDRMTIAKATEIACDGWSYTTPQLQLAARVLQRAGYPTLADRCRDVAKFKQERLPRGK